MRFNKIVVKNKVINKAISPLNPLVFLYQDLKVFLNGSTKLFDISSSKSLTTIWVDFSNVSL